MVLETSALLLNRSDNAEGAQLRLHDSPRIRKASKTIGKSTKSYSKVAVTNTAMNLFLNFKHGRSADFRVGPLAG
jgi:hypothetical protein